ncbi:MAG: DUF4491 family protein [Prevotellaceae bacterium]|nr:DUF4491 family protein [Prevotellaceae bacterium]
MTFLENYHLLGLTIGIATFLIIGLFHPVVIKAEYYWGTRCWWVFLLLGIIGIIISIFTGNVLVSALCGVFAFSSFWTIKELFEQKERVKKGWFPENPNRKLKVKR